MWPTLDRGRRLLRGTPAGSGNPPDAPRLDEPDIAGEVVIVFTRLDVERLAAALAVLLGDAVQRPDTPDRIERALGRLLVHRGAAGTVDVLRRPAAVSTPEAWEVRLCGTDPASATAVRDAGRTGSFAA